MSILCRWKRFQSRSPIVTATQGQSGNKPTSRSTCNRSSREITLGEQSSSAVRQLAKFQVIAMPVFVAPLRRKSPTRRQRPRRHNRIIQPSSKTRRWRRPLARLGAARLSCYWPGEYPKKPAHDTARNPTPSIAVTHRIALRVKSKRRKACE